MKARTRLSPLMFAALTWLAALGCQRMPPDRPTAQLPPAYASRQFNDPDLRELADNIKTESLHKAGPDGRALYSRAEVLPPVPIVQPYGVGVFQQEMRLSVILTTGPGWSTLAPAEKETEVAQAYRDFSERLKALKRDPPLHLTLTVQTPQGMEVSWINRLDSSRKNVHGDD